VLTLPTGIKRVIS